MCFNYTFLRFLFWFEINIDFSTTVFTNNTEYRHGYEYIIQNLFKICQTLQKVLIYKIFDPSKK